MPETIVMKVMSASLDEETDDNDKPTGKNYVVIRLEEVDPPRRTKWEITKLTLIDRMVDLHLGELVTVTVERAP